MELQLSRRVKKIKPSPTLAVSARAAELRASGENIISLGVGEPDFNTPNHIKQAAIDAINDGFTKYTAVDGIPELKKAIINKFKRDNKLDYVAEQVLVSCGGKQSCYNLMQALLNDGDEVLIPAPYWVSYPDMALLANAKPVFIDTSIEQNFKITPEQLEQAITPKTRLLIYSSPSNPSGKLYTRTELEALGEVLARHPQVLIASDDMYEHIVWTDEPFCNIVMACPKLYEQSIVLSGVSKAYAMTGWRIGFAAGPAPIIAAMKKIQSQSTSNPNSIAQKASVAALNGDQSIVNDMVKAFKTRHDFVYESFSAMTGVKCIRSDGTFYSFPDFSDVIKRLGLASDIEFAELLLQKAGIALVPGSAFGAPDCIRISYATSMEILKDAMERLKAAIS